MADPRLPDIYSSKPDKIEEKNLEPVVDPDAYITKKKSLFKKFAEFIFNGDIQEVRTHLLQDVLEPAIRETIFDLVNRGAEMLLFDNTAHPSPIFKKNQTIISYNDYSNKNKQKHYEHNSGSREVTSSDDEELLFKERGAAEKVLSRMVDILETYPYVTKEDLNTILKRTGKFTDNNWGWDNLSKARVERVRGYYLLYLPAPKHLD